MKPTPALLRPGFWTRSYEHFVRQLEFVWNLEGIKGPKHPRLLQSFHSRECVTDDIKLMSDKDIGGYSTAQADWVPPSIESYSGFMRFHGTISTRLPENMPDIQRTGYAAWRTRDIGPTLFGKSLWNIDPYAFLALRIKSDGRSYLVNIQTDGIVPTDIHQHRLFATRPGEWETVIFKWNDFVRTNGGIPVEPQMAILRQKVRSIGIGLTDRVEGPFELCVERIWATNTFEGLGTETPKMDRREVEILRAPGTPARSQVLGEALKNRRGEKVLWQSDGRAV